jgi:hypothetical protein
MVMRKVLFFILPVFFLLPTPVFSQLLAGRVLSETGIAASGVKVQFKNKVNTISTNPDGTFKIMASKLPDTLVFSAIGYEPYTVVITEKNIKDPRFEVVLLNTRKELGEVIVRGYASPKKMEMTGAVSSVSSESLEERRAGIDLGASYKTRSAGISTRVKSPSIIADKDESGRFVFFGDTTDSR